METMNSETTSSSLLGITDELSTLRPFGNNFVTGESIQFTEKCSEGSLMLTNYRMIMQFSGSTYNVPLGVIEQTEVRKVICLHIHCKDATSYKCTFPTSEACLNWQKSISDAIAMPSSIERVFAFTYYHSTLIANPELHSYFSSQIGGYSSYILRSNKIFDEEVKRLGLDIDGSWRISSANENYQLCPSYPRRIIVPAFITDNILEECARFRSSKRIPVVVWRHPNGAVIARSSQPEVGWLWWRSSEDEDLVKALSEASAYDSSTQSLNSSTDEDSQNKSSLNLSDLSNMCEFDKVKPQPDVKKLLIMDARSYATAVANRARGGGCECLEYYPKCDIQFMSLDNIHTIRKSHQALRNIVSLPSDIPNWLSLLESTRWLYHMSGLIKAAVTVAQTIAIEGRPVLVHCSDGWDRTPQIIALAELLLDPYYRTLEGFQVLVEREWIEFGHKFSDRLGCGIGSDDLNERCPVFLQWIDCVHQVLNQYPTAFQFNQSFLVKLAQHVYSCLFGTFLFNSSQERYKIEQQYSKNIPFSVWPLFKLHQHRYINHLYCQSNQVLYPSYHTKDLILFKAVYLNKMGNYQEEKHIPTEESSEDVDTGENSAEGELVKTKSCDNLLKSTSSLNSQLTRHSSDPNLRETFPDMALLNSALGADTFEESCSLTQLDRESSVCSIGDKDRVIYKDRKSKPVISLSHSNEPSKVSVSEPEKFQEMNGAPKFYIDDEDIGNENAKEGSLQKVKDADKRSIEGSTDTLVAEIGVLSTEENVKSPEDVSTSSKSSKLTVNGVKCIEDAPKKVVVANGRNGGLSFRSFVPEERAPEEIQNHCYITSSVAACSICLKNKKTLNETPPDMDIWKYSNSDEVVLMPAFANGVAECRTWRSGQFCTPGHSTSNSSCIPSTPNEERYMLVHQEKSLCASFSDGLSSYNDDVTRRLNQIKLQHQIEIDNLKRELQATRNFYHHWIHSKLSHINGENHTEDQMSLPESIGSGSGDSVGPESSGVSDASWEALEEGDANTTLWVPDHAVDSCMGCHSRFWIGRRKHHCRSCGKIFCAECSGNSVPIPKENLYDPVRVCGSCFSSLLEFRPKYVQVASN